MPCAAEASQGAEALWKLRACLARSAALAVQGSEALAQHAPAREALTRLLTEAAGTPLAGEGARRASGAAAGDEEEEEAGGGGGGAGGTPAGQARKSPRLLGHDVLHLALTTSHGLLVTSLIQVRPWSSPCRSGAGCPATCRAACCVL